ncbi:hypothetical protein D9M71_139190 [compost metagenome]
MRLDERLDIGQAVDARGVFQVSGRWVLMAVAKTHQGFVGPRVVVQHRYFDDTGANAALGNGLGFHSLHRLEQGLRRDAIRVEAHLERCVGQADVEHAFEFELFQRTGDGHAAKESLQGHAVGDFGKQVLIGTEAVTNGLAHHLSPLRRSANQVSSVPVLNAALCSQGCSSNWACRGKVVAMPVKVVAATA